jgi:hypothetical protein
MTFFHSTPTTETAHVTIPCDTALQMIEAWNRADYASRLLIESHFLMQTTSTTRDFVGKRELKCLIECHTSSFRKDPCIETCKRTAEWFSLNFLDKRRNSEV